MTIRKKMRRPGAGGAHVAATPGHAVQARAERKDGWTAARRRAFLDELAMTCNVTASLNAVGMSAANVYRLRQRDAGFRAEWARALNEGYARLELTLLDRAFNGTVKTVEGPDGRINKTTEFPNAVALTLLRMHREGAAEAETEYDPQRIEEARARLGRKLDAMARRLEAEDAAKRTEGG